MNLKARLEKLEQMMPKKHTPEDGPTLEELKKMLGSHNHIEKEKFYEAWQHHAPTQLNLLKAIKVKVQMLGHDDETFSEEEKLHEQKWLDDQKQKALARLAKHHPELDVTTVV
jgi:hypothetical protein